MECVLVYAQTIYLGLVVVDLDIHVTVATRIIRHCMCDVYAHVNIHTLDQFDACAKSGSGSISFRTVDRITKLCEVDRTCDRCVGQVDYRGRIA
jgi:hypothetical protein